MKQRQNKQRQETLKGTLQTLGISDGAEDVYIVLIENGSLLLSDISKKTFQFRPDTYRFIKELLGAGLVTQIQLGKRKKYEAVSPESIYSILKKTEDTVLSGVTKMLEIFDGTQNAFQTEVFEGKDGISALFKILVEKAKKRAQLCRIESPKDYKLLKKYYPKEYWKRAGFRSGGDIEKYVITNPITKNSRQKNLNRSSKSIPDKFLPFAFNYTTLIIEDKVALIDFDNERGMLIRDQRFADYMKSIFWMLYGLLG